MQYAASTSGNAKVRKCACIASRVAGKLAPTPTRSSEQRLKLQQLTETKEGFELMRVLSEMEPEGPYSGVIVWVEVPKLPQHTAEPEVAWARRPHPTTNIDSSLKEFAGCTSASAARSSRRARAPRGSDTGMLACCRVSGRRTAATSLVVRLLARAYKVLKAP